MKITFYVTRQFLCPIAHLSHCFVVLNIYIIVSFFLPQLDIVEFIPSLLYFGYTALMVLSFWLLTGTIGFYAAYVFIRKIYAAVKIDWNMSFSFCLLFFFFCFVKQALMCVNCWREVQQRPPVDWRNEQRCVLYTVIKTFVLLSLPQQRCRETTWTVPFLMSVYPFAHTTWAKVCRLTFSLCLGGGCWNFGLGLILLKTLKFNCILYNFTN